MTTMLLSRLHHPVTTLGYGTRAGIWFQGCTIRCRGCVSADTWPARAASAVPVAAVVEWLAAIEDPIDGVTISGGEPTDQPDALRDLLGAVVDLRDARGENWDVLVYSGHTRDVLDARLPWLAQVSDAVVVGPYVQRLAREDPLRGSANQEVVVLSDRGAERYASDRLASYAPQRGEMNVCVDNDAIWLVGIPRPGDMARLRARLAERGVRLGRISWLP